MTSKYCKVFSKLCFITKLCSICQIIVTHNIIRMGPTRAVFIARAPDTNVTIMYILIKKSIDVFSKQLHNSMSNLMFYAKPNYLRTKEGFQTFSKKSYLEVNVL